MNILMLCASRALATAAFAIALSVSALQQATASPQEVFQQGIEAYRGGNYLQATESFRAATRLHPSSGALQNLGLAEWQRGHTGEAILAWEQARRLDPLDRKSVV